jgi:hypothetical protein
MLGIRIYHIRPGKSGQVIIPVIYTCRGLQWKDISYNEINGELTGVEQT